MSHRLSDKAIACLFTLTIDSQMAREMRMEWLCEKYHPKAVYACFERLCARGYAEPLSRDWNGWPTPRGMAALTAHTYLNNHRGRSLQYNIAKVFDAIAYRLPQRRPLPS
jgi:hypothetical protein